MTHFIHTSSTGSGRKLSTMSTGRLPTKFSPTSSLTILCKKASIFIFSGNLSTRQRKYSVFPPVKSGWGRPWPVSAQLYRADSRGQLALVLVLACSVRWNFKRPPHSTHSTGLGGDTKRGSGCPRTADTHILQQMLLPSHQIKSCPVVLNRGHGSDKLGAIKKWWY